MAMRPISPHPMLGMEHHRALVDVGANKRTRGRRRTKQRSKGKAPVYQSASAPATPRSWNSSTIFTAQDHHGAGSSTTKEHHRTQGSQHGKEKSAADHFYSAHDADRAKGKFKMFKKGQKSHRKHQTVSEGGYGRGHMSHKDKNAAVQRYQSMLESGKADPFTAFMATDNYGALDAVVQLPPARLHSISDDTVLISKPALQRRHSLSSDALVGDRRPGGLSHLLGHDKVINASPWTRGEHRLSADAMLPVRTIAPGHYLDADPTVSSLQHLFPHELLEDERVLRPKSPQAHSLDRDKKFDMLHRQTHPHGLHSDAILPLRRAQTAHTLESDGLVPAAMLTHGSHDMSHDVRIVSPGSGQIREPHGIDEDEVVRETAVFRKSPHPDTVTAGKWASWSGGGESKVEKPIATLSTSLHTANQALSELNRAAGASRSGKENTAGIGTWCIHPVLCRRVRPWLFAIVELVLHVIIHML